MLKSISAPALVALAIAMLPAGAAGDQASQPGSSAAGRISAGKYDSCAVLSGSARCWGFGGDGRLGYGSLASIGDDETPGSVGPIDVGGGRSVVAISAGNGHTCALLDDGSVRCWGFGGNGRLGYANTDSVAAPASVGPVFLGAGRSATMISAGDAHTCAVLDNGTVRCWGFGLDGRLGYANKNDIGDDETPGSVAPVDLGAHTATAVSAGRDQTCALLDDASLRCWGYGGFGHLGYGNIDSIGDNETPGSAGPVALGNGRTATAVSAGSDHTCAVLDRGGVKCWGYGANGQLGYGNTSAVGSTNTPADVGTVDLGRGRTAQAISAGGDHTCAVLDDASVRCWGEAGFGQLGRGNTDTIGDDEAPGSVATVDLGAGRTAAAVDTGDLHTCALLDDSSVRCWGYGDAGRLGYCSQLSVGDNEAPAAAGPVDLGSGGAACPSSPAPDAIPEPAPAGAGPQTPATGAPDDGRSGERARAARMSTCLRRAARRVARQRKRARRSCFVSYSRVPGRVTRLRASAETRSKIVLTFRAPASDGRRPPAARTYLVKQSRGPLRSTRDFDRAQTLCKASCAFAQTVVGATLKLTVTQLRPHTTYRFAVAARDNVSHRRGPRSLTAVVRTR